MGSKKNFIAKKSKWLPRIADWVTSHGGGTVIPFSVEYEEEVFGAFQAGGLSAKQAVIGAHQGTKSVLPRIIKGELCAYDDFKEHCGGKASMANLKSLGKYRQEGKNYVVKDGDIIEFKFNVS